MDTLNQIEDSSFQSKKLFKKKIDEEQNQITKFFNGPQVSSDQSEDTRNRRRRSQEELEILSNQGLSQLQLDLREFYSLDKTLIMKSLGSHFTFSALIKDKAMQEHLIDKFRLCRVNKGDYLMKQNDNASSFFILHDGELIVEIDEHPKRKIGAGEGFGELALLYSSPRSASIKANKASFLWYIDRATFRQAISSITQKNFHQNRQLIEKSQFFRYLTSSQKDKIASIAITQHFTKSTKICKEGQQASSFYIVKSGIVGKSKTPQEAKEPAVTYKAGSSFGEYTLIEKNSKWKQTIVSEGDSVVIALGSEDIEQVLGKSLPLIIIRNRARQLLSKKKDTSKLSSHHIDLILDCFKIRNVQPNQQVGSSQNSTLMFFVLEGSYQIVGKNSATIESSSEQNKILYGSLIEGEKDSKVSAVFSTQGKIAWAMTSEIIKSLGCSLEQAILKSEEMQKSTMNHRNYVYELRARCSKYSINDYKVLTKLGQGQFGTVFLVTDPTKSNLYALKCISKQETVKNRLEKHLINQKIVLEEMNEQSPFCVNYIRSYKDQNWIYFLMEYINGLELFDVIRIIGILTPDQTQFYGAIMLNFLQALHSKGIIYRDLKPQNVMVEENGYLKLIDMGTCKKMNQEDDLKTSSLGKTFTIIGTPNYMAPEIISGKGYSYSADLWSLGVVLYEFMAGYVPFGEEAQDPYEIYQEILKKPLNFPNYMKCGYANSFIIQLLSKNPQARLCGSYSSLKKHPFLSKIDWSALLSKTMEPAFLLPKNKLIEVGKFMGKLKPLSSQLPVAQSKNLSKGVVKKDTKDNNWDECF